MVQRLNALGREWQLHYACRSREDMAFRQELEAMPQAALHFDDESGGHSSTSPPSSRPRPRTRISIVAARRRCCRRSRPRPRTGRASRFTSNISPPRSWRPAKKGGFTVELARSGVEYFIPEGETILNVLLDAGIDIDYSCELGICGACEQRVISGIPEHRDSILSEEEQAENKRVMICCAGCKSERLVLDL